MKDGGFFGLQVILLYSPYYMARRCIGVEEMKFIFCEQISCWRILILNHDGEVAMNKKSLFFKVIIGVLFTLGTVSFSMAESGGGLEKGNILPPFNIKMPENSDGIPSLGCQRGQGFPLDANSGQAAGHRVF